MSPKLYPLAESLNSTERKALDISIKDSLILPTLGLAPRNVAAIRTGGFRIPKKDEWYLSGAIPEAHRAPNTLSSAYHILRLVKTKTTTVTTTVIVKP